VLAQPRADSAKNRQALPASRRPAAAPAAGPLAAGRRRRGGLARRPGGSSAGAGAGLMRGAAQAAEVLALGRATLARIIGWG